MKNKNLSNNNGITLIALIITIIVMLILVAVTINMAVNGGLFGYAGNATKETKNAQDEELLLAEGIVDGKTIDQWVNGETPVTNPYNEDEWIYAWTCANGTWSEMISAGGSIENTTQAENFVIAKLYLLTDMSNPELSIVIEGNGQMGVLADDIFDSSTYHAWRQMTAYLVYIKDVIICDGVTNLPLGAFAECTGLESVVIANSVISLGTAVFNGCTSLTSVTIPNSVTSLGNNTFINCTNLTNVIISNSITNTGIRIFSGCTSLINITIPNSVTNIGFRAFEDCTSLISITYQGTKNEWNNINKSSFWDSDSAITTIHCTDGDITL